MFKSDREKKADYLWMVYITVPLKTWKYIPFNLSQTNLSNCKKHLNIKYCFFGLRESGICIHKGHTQRLYLRMSTMGRHPKYKFVRTSKISLREINWLWFWHILFLFLFSLEESCLPTQVKQDFFSKWLVSESRAQQEDFREALLIVYLHLFYGL